MEITCKNMSRAAHRDHRIIICFICLLRPYMLVIILTSSKNGSDYAPVIHTTCYVLNPHNNLTFIQQIGGVALTMTTGLRCSSGWGCAMYDDAPAQVIIHYWLEAYCIIMSIIRDILSRNKSFLSSPIELLPDCTWPKFGESCPLESTA